jgi:hypothetical protein
MEEDQEVRRLCESGDLKQVAGSQSLLSQELLEQSQQSQSQPTDDDINFTQDSNDDDNKGADSCSKDMYLSAHAVSVAQRYGILTQEDDDDDDDENQENAPANISHGPASAGTTRSTGTSPLKLITQQQSHHDDVTVRSKVTTSKAKDSSTSTCTTSVPLPLPILFPISFPISLSPPPNARGTTDDITGALLPAPVTAAYDYDDTMDLVMELDEAFTGLDAIKQAATTGNKRGKKRSKSNTNTNTNENENAGPTTTPTPNVFGSLLDAVQVVRRQSQSQIMSPRFSPRLQKQRQQREHSMDPHMTTSGNMLFPPAHTPAEVANAAAANKKRKLQAKEGLTKEAPPASSNKDSTKHPILKSQPLTQPTQSPPLAISSKRNAVAQRAAALALRVSSDADLAKRLLLSMAMLRDNPRQVPVPSPPAGHFLEDGFFWAHYPPLEQILKDNMARYYALSMGKCQSPEQHTFNNTLVVLVRQTVTEREWSFDRIFMCDKVLRDRIRCYYKTHIQNAKKRLRTMLKNPTKKANASHLIQHWELIRETIVSASKQQQVPMNSVISTSTTTSPSSISDSNNESGSKENAATKVTKNAAARRVTMEESAIEKTLSAAAIGAERAAMEADS